MYFPSSPQRRHGPVSPACSEPSRSRSRLSVPQWNPPSPYSTPPPLLALSRRLDLTGISHPLSLGRHPWSSLHLHCRSKQSTSSNAPESLTPRFSRLDLYPPPPSIPHARPETPKQAAYMSSFIAALPCTNSTTICHVARSRCTPLSPVRSDGLAWLHPRWPFALSATLRILHHHTCQTDRATLRGRWQSLRPRVTNDRMSWCSARP
ncbi:hypothetical protein IWZ00DRAFT_10061 [Phyllosticta capitalensis]